MANREYTSRRRKIVDSLVTLLKTIDGTGSYQSNLERNVHPKLKFWDEISQFPEIHINAGNESREYLPASFKWRFLIVTIRVYVNDPNDPQEKLALIFEDIETKLEDNSAFSYTDNDGNTKNVTQISIISVSTDEGVLTPLGVGEMVIEIRY